MTSDEGRRRDARRARDDNRHFRLISVFAIFPRYTGSRDLRLRAVTRLPDSLRFRQLRREILLVCLYSGHKRTYPFLNVGSRRICRNQ